jgi:hypothetical protein
LHGENSNKWACGPTKIKKLCRFFGKPSSAYDGNLIKGTKSSYGSLWPMATDGATNAGAVLQLKNEQRKQYSYLEDSSHNNGDFF